MIGWYCRCCVGVRVVGMCVYIVVVLWYIGLGCDMEFLRFVRDWSKFIDDVVVILDVIDELELEDDFLECLNE